MNNTNQDKNIKIYVMNNGGMSCVGDKNANTALNKPNVILLKFGDCFPPDGSIIVYKTNEIGGWFGIRVQGTTGRLFRFRSFKRTLAKAAAILKIELLQAN